MGDPQMAGGDAAEPPSLRHRHHIALVLLTALLWASVVLEAMGRGSPLVLLAALAAYLIAALLSSIPRYLVRLGSADDIAQYIARLRATPPGIAVYWRCWRVAMRPQLVTRPTTQNQMGPGGKMQMVTRMETHTEMQQTTEMLGEGREPFAISHWQDASPEAARTLFSSPIMSIDFSVTVEADPATETALAAFKDAVRARHATAGAMFTLSETRGIDGLRPKMLAVVDRQARPWLLGIGGYVLATMLGLAGLYALWFDRVAGYGSYVFVKRVTA